MEYSYASGFVTMKDVETYFKGEGWPIAEAAGDEFHAESKWNFQIDLKRGDSVFQVKIESPDDPLDSEEIMTPDPVKSITDFLSQGMSKSEWLHAATDSNAFSNTLKRLARSIDNSRTPSLSKVSRILRRISLVEIPGLRMAKRVEKEIDPLLDRLKEEGWKVDKKGEGPNALLQVDVGEGSYKAEISPEQMKWEFKIQFKGNDDLTVEGVTDDPIAEYMKWKKNPKVGDAWQDFKHERSDAKEQENSNRTMPATPKRKKPQ